MPSTVQIIPTMMKGRLLPSVEVQVSDKAPTMSAKMLTTWLMKWPTCKCASKKGVTVAASSAHAPLMAKLELHSRLMYAHDAQGARNALQQVQSVSC